MRNVRHRSQTADSVARGCRRDVPPSTLARVVRSLFPHEASHLTPRHPSHPLPLVPTHPTTGGSVAPHPARRETAERARRPFERHARSQRTHVGTAKCTASPTAVLRPPCSLPHHTPPRTATPTLRRLCRPPSRPPPLRPRQPQLPPLGQQALLPRPPSSPVSPVDSPTRPAHSAQPPLCSLKVWCRSAQPSLRCSRRRLPWPPRPILLSVWRPL